MSLIQQCRSTDNSRFFRWECLFAANERKSVGIDLPSSTALSGALKTNSLTLSDAELSSIQPDELNGWPHGFVESSLKFIRPGGHLVIVLPDSILNNPGLRFIRILDAPTSEAHRVYRPAQNNFQS